MSEPHAIRLKRLTMRAGHRGTKEMDIILTRWTDLRLQNADTQTLDIFEALLEENDQDLYQWVSEQGEPPLELKGIVADLRAIVGGRKEFDPN